MRAFDPAEPLIHVPQIPAGVMSGQWLPGFQPALGSIDFATRNLFDVSAFDAWMLQVDVSTQAGAGVPSVTLQWFNAADDLATVNRFAQSQTITLPRQPIQPFPVIILGRILSPLLGVQLYGTYANNGPNRIDLFVSNRTRLYDAPYTPAALGTILAAIPQTAVAAGTQVAEDLPFYLGPARLSGYFADSVSPAAVARVIDDTAPQVQVLGYVSPTTTGVAELWVPSQLPNTTKWQLDAFNDSAGTVSMEAILTAA